MERGTTPDVEPSQEHESQVTDGTVMTDTTTDAPEASPSGPRSPLAALPLKGGPKSFVEWFSVAFAVYVLITAVGVIGDGFKTATGGQAAELFSFAQNPIVALVIGVLATALTQSSSTTTSIVVGLVAGGLPMEIAIPMLMGANIGTTMTSTLVSLGAAGERNEFRRAFSAASVHDFYNLLAVAFLLPLELMFGILDKSASWLADGMRGSDGGIVASVFTAFGDFVSMLTDPGTDLISGIITAVTGENVVGGIVLIVVGIALILVVIKFISDMLKSLLVGKAEKVFHTAIGRGPLSGVFSGMLITVMVQSSSTTTSLTVPLAASGKFSIKQIYPFTVGANIGTTVTALIAAFSFTGVEGTAALTAASVHFLFNTFAAFIIFGLPFLRPLPIKGALFLGELGARNKMYVVAWLAGLFVVLPLLLIAVSSWI